jgi:flagellar biosynthesis protein FlhA
VNRITGIRKQVSKALGFVIPPVRVRDDMALKANDYRIRIGQTIVGEDQVYPDMKLAIPGDATSVKIAGVEVKDPTFGMDAIWIDRHKEAEAESNGYVVVEPESVLATHISQMMYKFAHELIGQDDVKVLLDNLAQTSPSLVESVVPKAGTASCFDRNFKRASGRACADQRSPQNFGNTCQSGWS